MTTEEVLLMCRRFLGQVDIATSTLTDEEILAVMSDERDILELELVPDFEDFTIGYDQTAGENLYGIEPEASLTLEIGTILALKAAVTLLKQQYQERVSRGELGTSWTSGLESESTLQAGREYQQMIKDLERRASSLIIIKRRDEHGFRAQ